MDRRDTAGGEEFDTFESASQVSAASNRSRRSELSQGGQSSVSQYASLRLVKKSAERAGLEARMAMLKDLHELEEEEAKLRRKREIMEVKAKLVEAQAKENVLANFSDCLEPEASVRGMEIKAKLVEAQAKENVLAKFSDCLEPEASVSDMIAELTQTGGERSREQKIQQEHTDSQRPIRYSQQCNGNEPGVSNLDAVELVRKMQLPTLKIQPFNGDPTQYSNFIRGFDAKIACRVEDDEEKLYYLDQFTTGKPHDMVLACLHMAPGEGYAEARRLLQEWFGNEIQTVTCMIEKMMSWPTIGSGVDDLDRYAIFLRGCWNALKGIPRGVSEVDAKTIRRILQKLPKSISDRWRRRADVIEHEQWRMADFGDLVQLLEREARINMNPSYGQQFELKMAGATASTASTLAGQPWIRTETATGSFQSAETPKTCQVCSQKHSLCDCPQLMSWSLDERKNYIFKHGLCFGCLRKGHLSKDCKNRRTCSTCQGKHPTLLHRQGGEPEPTVTSFHLSTEQVRHIGAKLPVVTVLVQLGQKEVQAYALLDTGSTHSFCTVTLFRELGAVSRETMSLNLTTVDRQRRVEGYVVNGATITDVDHNNLMALPPLFTLDRIPASKEDVATSDDLDSWPYLIQRGVTMCHPEENIGLLLGNDCGYAMEPMQVVPSQGGGPHAIETRYGWILGGARKDKLTTVKVNKIQVTDQVREQLGHAISDNLADTRTGPSVEDVEWCRKVDESCCRKNGKYQIKLPFRDEKPYLPNNYGVARKRLEILKIRFQKNPKMLDHYKKQMADIIKKGYAERAHVMSSGSRNGRVWYLPHHGVYHPQRPDKVRVVFDCAARYKDTSLNDLLLQGPELTNPLIDILLRFRQDRVAFMADVAEMFLQVGVPEEDRDFLRFLWWRDEDALLL